MRFLQTAISQGLSWGLVVYIEDGVCVCVHAFQVLWPLPHPYRLRSSLDDGYQRTSTLISFRSEKDPISSFRGALKTVWLSFIKAFASLSCFCLFIS